MASALNPPRKTVCVYCASSGAVDEFYFNVARALGRALAEQGWDLVYGGGKVGLMGALAEAVHSHGGRVCGIIPEFMVHEGRAYDACNEFIVTSGMRERKALMEARADAFIALPGGFGTLEELLEVVTLKLLRVHAKPIVIVNANGFYDPLVALFDHFANQRFASSDHRQFYYLAKNACDAIEHVMRSFAPCERAARRTN